MATAGGSGGSGSSGGSGGMKGVVEFIQGQCKNNV